MATQLEINQDDARTLHALQYKYHMNATTADYTKRGWLYFHGLGGPFNYNKAMKYLGRHGYTNNGNANDVYPENGGKIARIKILKMIHFDALLNRLRSDGVNCITAERETVSKLFIDLSEAASAFVMQEKNRLIITLDLNTFRMSCIRAIGDSHKTLISNHWEVLLTKFLGAVMSIGTLGIANYATGRSMYGLLSSRIDTTVKLGEFLKNCGYVDEGCVAVATSWYSHPHHQREATLTK